MKKKIKGLKRYLIRFVKKTVKSHGFKKVILGLSGGVDSATVAYLSKEALGKTNVIAVIMPYRDVDPEGIKFASRLIKELGIKSYRVDISPMVDTYFKYFPNADRIRRGNKQARERMTVLYDLSKKENALVIGSGNKTEILLGYCTLYGDSACALNPLANLYKTEVYSLAKELGVPEAVIKRRPTAGLWKGQTDEGELGHSYADMDKLLHMMIDLKKSDSGLKKAGFDPRFIDDIKKRIKESEFKRRSTIIPLI